MTVKLGAAPSSVLMCVAMCAAPLACAQNYPVKPIRLIATFTAGGPVDLTARLIGQKLNEAWGQPVLIENRIGASGMIGCELVAKSAPDGYTVLVNSSIHVIVSQLFAKMAYDPIRDFMPVTVVSSAPLMLVVTPSLPPRNVNQFVALAKARPGELSFASSGLGASTHLTAELFKVVTNTAMVHVPYKGQSQALTDVMSGQVPLMFNTIPASLELVRAGRLRALAVTANKRVPQIPDIPTFAEAGYKDMVTSSWYAIWLPAKTPEAIVTRLGDEVRRNVAQPDVRKRIIEMGGEPVGNSAAEFDAFQRAEAALWAKVAARAGLKRE